MSINISSLSLHENAVGVVGSRLLVSPAGRILFLISLAACSAVGCAGQASRYVPPTGSGRQALEDALNAWQNGQPVGEIQTVSTPVQAVDSVWSKKQKLASYEILEEVPRDDRRRCFKVRLHLENPPSTQEVLYVITGISPLWVFREEDFNSFQNWGGGSGQKR